MSLSRHFLIVGLVLPVFMAHAQFAGMVDLDVGMSPRYYLGSPPQVAKRQSGSCGTGFHHCQDINEPTLCCADDHYCYISTSGVASCCSVGIECETTCPLSAYLCNATTIVTASSSTATSTASACCSRSCSAYYAYQCALSYGAGCCSLGYSCATSACVSTYTPATTVVSEAPSGCTTNQITCASSLGGGCCNIGSTCTNIGISALCGTDTSGTSALHTATNGALISVTTVSNGLSTGAKAGIGVGVGLAGCAMTAAVLFFCMHRQKTRAITNHTESERTQGMSQAGPGAARSRPLTTGDYFGPVAQAGPYTDTSGVVSVHGTLGRGVPVNPHGPGDIASAVEIGTSREHSTLPTPGEVSHIREYDKFGAETAEDRAELP